jgi:hypothetical protein
MKLTRRQKQVLAGMKRGLRLWRYSTSNMGYLVNGEDAMNVRRQTIEALEEAGLIEIDFDKSYFRADSGSDNVYKLVAHEKVN